MTRSGTSARVVSGAGGWVAAAEALERGGVVAIPTDTVYGLAARVDRPGAIAAVFTLKGRPDGLALPVLVSDERQAATVAATWPPLAAALAAHLWPGALTLVVPAELELAGRLGSTSPTVGVRCPDHSGVRRLCERTGPLAVTSANRHAEPPCTAADQVAAAVPAVSTPSALELVVDGGVCDGVPSTVVDCTGTEPRCLRAGEVPWEAVLAVARGVRPG